MQIDDYANAYLFHYDKGRDWQRLAKAAKSAGRYELVEAAEYAMAAHDNAAELWGSFGRSRFGDDRFDGRCDLLAGGEVDGQLDLDAAVAGLAQRVTPEAVR